MEYKKISDYEVKLAVFLYTRKNYRKAEKVYCEALEDEDKPNTTAELSELKLWENKFIEAEKELVLSVRERQ